MDENKKKKIILLIIVAVCIAAIVAWIIFSSPKEKTYEYEGYVTSIQQNADSAVLTAISANGESEFIITKKTKKEYKDDATTINVGDCIRLNTTKDSDTEVKEFLVFSAFSMNGKIVNVEGKDTPYMMTTIGTNAYRSYSLMAADNSAINLPTGTIIKIYYQYPLNSASEQIVADIIKPTSDVVEPLTEAETSHIERNFGTAIP